MVLAHIIRSTFNGSMVWTLFTVAEEGTLLVRVETIDGTLWGVWHHLVIVAQRSSET